MSHSKRNTSLAFFTAHERASLRNTWGSQSTRLTRESFLPFGSCSLCLLSAIDPVACPSAGHLFCRECAFSNLLAQNREINRVKKEEERRREEEVLEREEGVEVERARDLEEFERVQAGFDGGQKGVNGRRGGAALVAREAHGTKRKLDDQDDDAAKGGEKARRTSSSLVTKTSNTTSGDAAQDQNVNGNFWVPSQIPQNQKRDAQTTKQNPICPASEPSTQHPFSLKTLVSVRFSSSSSSGGDIEKIVTREEASSSAPDRICPACNKALSNTSKAVLAKPCGHVLCKACSEKFQKPVELTPHHDGSAAGEEGTVRCYVCEEDVTPGRTTKKKGEKGAEGKDKKEKTSKIERGLVELSSEGTGFAGGGNNMVKKHGLAFQC